MQQSTPRTRQIVAAVIGNALEWYDFVVYGFMTVIISRLFFPTESEYASLLLAMATFGVGFFMRPVGGILIGLYADRKGRKAALQLIIGLMTIAVAMIAFAPPYAVIGAAAPVLIVAARLLQGFATGGEFASATAFLVESAPAERRGFFGSLQMVGQSVAALAGASSGMFITQSLTPEQIDQWGWRIPFMIGLLIGPVGLYIRRHLEETEVFKAAHVELPKNIITAMQLHGLKRYLHMSALGADSQGPSMYQRSKGDGEAAVRASNLDWTIFRPSVIFGAQDQFINLFSKLTKLFPAMPLANHQAQFQPVSVDDVATAFVKSLLMPQTIRQSYDLVGPTVYTMKEIVEFAAHKAKTSCAIIPVPAFVGYIQALAFEFLPGPTLMSRDNIASMQLPNILPVNGTDALLEVFKMSRRTLEGMR